MRWGVVLLILFIVSNLYSQSTAGEGAIYESRYIVDMPNAGVLGKGDYVFYSSVFSEGGVSLLFEASPFRNFSLGISYSGVNIVGSGAVRWQNIPGVHLKFRLFDECKSLPAITVGANTQGKGFYSFSEKRFVTLSPGMYLALSKNYRWFLGMVSFHTGINYSLEPIPERRKANFYLGLEHSIGKYVSANFEYNFNFDEEKGLFYEDRGLMNLALRWSISKGITLELQARDLLENVKYYSGYNRAIVVEYIGVFE